MRKFKEVMACEHRTFGNRLKDNFVEVKTSRRCYAVLEGIKGFYEDTVAFLQEWQNGEK